MFPMLSPRKLPDERLDSKSLTSGKALLDTRVGHLMVITAIRVLGRFRRRQGTVLFLTPSVCVKYGPLCHLPEASNMEFIAKNTSIPVPRIYGAFRRKGCTYIIMEKVQGKSLVYDWTSRPQESKVKILKQLSDMIETMRQLPSPSAAVANADGGPLWDCRLPGPTYDFGPFPNIDQFHLHLRGGVQTKFENFPAGVHELIDRHNQVWSAPVFTHGDLSSLNIMAEGDQITGIVDWETAGWYPAYWEYTTACQVNFRNTFWRAEIDHFLQPYPEELQMEKLRQTYFGDT